MGIKPTARDELCEICRSRSLQLESNLKLPDGPIQLANLAYRQCEAFQHKLLIFLETHHPREGEDQ